jgi:hypothetical protein
MFIYIAILNRLVAELIAFNEYGCRFIRVGSDLGRGYSGLFYVTPAGLLA